MIKEVTVFSYGDSNSLQTWSNVPFFLTSTIEKKKIKVNRVNVKPNKVILTLWNRIIVKLIRLIFKNTTYEYDRTPFFRFFVNRKMKAAVKKYKNSDAYISVSFSYHPKKYTQKPVMMFCDWTYDYYFKYFLQRKPDFLEKQEIKNQQRLFKTADEVVFLFPDVAEYENKINPKSNIFYLGNVINSDPMSLTKEMLKNKYTNKTIVFIGGPKYMQGLQVLIDAVEALHNRVPEVTLEIIGIKRSQYVGGETHNFIRFWGYLNKSVELERKRYYSIVDSATVFVNTTPVWSSFSATLDVMYHYTPIVVSKYRSFTETFGEKITFGKYSKNVKEDVTKNLLLIMNSSYNDYLAIAGAARRSVEPFSWDSYVDQLLKKLKTEE